MFTLVADVSPRWVVCLKRGGVTTQPGLPRPPAISALYSPQLSSRVWAGVRNEALMSCTIRRPWSSVQEAPSLRRVVYVCWTCLHYLGTRLHHTFISDNYTDCFYYTLINPFYYITLCVELPFMSHAESRYVTVCVCI